jgi:uncharacterized protein (TIGR02246 family)
MILRMLIRAAWIVIASPAVLLLAPASASAADQTITDFEGVQQAAWSAHDAAAYTAAFDQNADIITSLGWHWAGQTEAARNLGVGFRLVYARAHLRLSDVQVRTLTPELSFVTLNWSIEGARTIDGGLPAGEQHGLETQLLQRRGQSWLVLSQQDTAASAPLPTSSPSAEPAIPAVTAFPTSPPPVRRCIFARANGQCMMYGKSKKTPAS